MRDVEIIPGATSTLRRRLYAKIRRGKNRDACAIWTGATARKRGSRRPKIRVGGNFSRHVVVARVLLVLKDRVPLWIRDDAKLEAAHECGHYWCVNVRHLAWKTRVENENDKYAYSKFEDALDELLAETA